MDFVEQQHRVEVRAEPIDSVIAELMLGISSFQSLLVGTVERIIWLDGREHPFADDSQIKRASKRIREELVKDCA